MLFVDDDERQVFDGREHRRARAYDDLLLATADVMPLLGTLVVGEAGVQHGDLSAEDLMQVRGRSRGEADLRYEHDGAATRVKHLLHGGEIDRRFAGAR